MGVIKGDLLSESDKLAECSLVAAGFYSLFLANSEITDDFGRFRLLPELLLAKAFAKRLDRGKRDVTAKRIMEWFGEYERVGLIRTWKHDGSTWAEWTNWQAKPPSKRRFHRAPEPPWSDHEHSTTCSQSGSRWAAVRQTNGSRTAAGGAPSPCSPCSPVVETPPSPPSRPPAGGQPPGGSGPASAVRARRQRRREHRAIADELVRYSVELIGARRLAGEETTSRSRIDPSDAERLFELLERGYTRRQLQGSISERIREQLVSWGYIASDESWPPPGMAAYDAHGPPAGGDKTGGDGGGGDEAGGGGVKLARKRTGHEAEPAIGRARA